MKNFSIIITLFALFTSCTNKCIIFNTYKIKNAQKVKSGYWIEYSDSTKTYSITKYKNGTKNGVFAEYNIYNTLQTTGCFKNGVKDGSWYYYSNGLKISMEKYKNGIRKEFHLYNPRF